MLEGAELVEQDAELVEQDAQLVEEGMELVGECVELVGECVKLVGECVELVGENVVLVEENVVLVGENVELVEENGEVVGEVVELVVEEIVELVGEVAEVVELVEEDVELVGEGRAGGEDKEEEVEYHPCHRCLLTCGTKKMILLLMTCHMLQTDLLVCICRRTLLRLARLIFSTWSWVLSGWNKWFHSRMLMRKPTSMATSPIRTLVEHGRQQQSMSYSATWRSFCTLAVFG